jgi:hypothetical protein
MKDINKYFPRIRNQSGATWGDVCLLHTNDFSDIISVCQNSLDAAGHGLYKKRLQCINVKCIGWLLYSFRAIDTRALSNKLDAEYNLKADFRYAAINLDRMHIPIEQQIRALHIWIPNDSTFIRTKRSLQALYSSAATTFPLDIKMRLVPAMETITKLHHIDQIKKLKGRQGTFTKKVEASNCISWDITNLDCPTGGLPSLRSLIMDAKPSSGKGSLFLSVDYAYKRNDLVIFSFLPVYALEARAFANRVAAYIILKYQANEAVQEYFTPDACSMVEDVEWDEATKQIITKEEKYLDNLLALEDDLWLLDDEEPATTNTVQVSHTPTRIENIFLGNCDDSVGTLRSNGNTVTRVQGNSQSNVNASTTTAGNSRNENTTTSNLNSENEHPSSVSPLQGNRRFSQMEASVNQWVNESASRSTTTPPRTNTASRSHLTTSGPAS